MAFTARRPLREPWPRPVDWVLYAGDTLLRLPPLVATRAAQGLQPLPSTAAWPTMPWRQTAQPLR
jgi:hypothetical protein